MPVSLKLWNFQYITNTSSTIDTTGLSQYHQKNPISNISYPTKCPSIVMNLTLFYQRLENLQCKYVCETYFFRMKGTVHSWNKCSTNLYFFLSMRTNKSLVTIIPAPGGLQGDTRPAKGDTWLTGYHGNRLLQARTCFTDHQLLRMASTMACSNDENVTDPIFHSYFIFVYFFTTINVIYYFMLYSTMNYSNHKFLRCWLWFIGEKEFDQP